MDNPTDPTALSPCPGCGAAHLRVTRFKARDDRSCARLPQLGGYEPGGIRPTVVVECTAGCGFVAEGPGTLSMLGTVLAAGPALAGPPRSEGPA